jgi:hypothetical protein
VAWLLFFGMAAFVAWKLRRPMRSPSGGAYVKCCRCHGMFPDAATYLDHTCVLDRGRL